MKRPDLTLTLLLPPQKTSLFLWSTYRPLLMQVCVDVCAHMGTAHLLTLANTRMFHSAAAAAVEENQRRVEEPQSAHEDFTSQCTVLETHVCVPNVDKWLPSCTEPKPLKHVSMCSKSFNLQMSPTLIMTTRVRIVYLPLHTVCLQFCSQSNFSKQQLLNVSLVYPQWIAFCFSSKK